METRVSLRYFVNDCRLVSNLTSYAINKFERKISGKGAARAEKGFTLSYE